MTNKKLWGGRFNEPLDRDAITLSYSLESDKRLVQYDLLVNQAHITALHAGGWLLDNEFQTLYDCLEQLKIDFLKMGLGRSIRSARTGGSHGALHDFWSGAWRPLYRLAAGEQWQAGSR